VLAILAVFSSSGWARTIFVATNGQHVAPFTNSWIAATNIQSAVDVATNGDVVLVGDGIYSLPTTVNITNGITLMSMGGPQAAVLNGRGSVRGLYLDHTNARVEGFTIHSCVSTVYGSSPAQGGGIFIQRAAIIDSCIIFSNRVEGYGWESSAGYGQGAGIFATSNLMIRNCLVYANIARGVGGDGWWDMYSSGGPGGNGYGYGGGLYSTGEMSVENCTIASNQAIGVGGSGGGWGADPGVGYAEGGGVFAVSTDAIVANSIIQSNLAGGVIQNWTGGSYTYSCTLPQPDGAGNISNDPLFVSLPGSDFHLSGASPCIDRGSNSYVTADGDLGDNPRIVNGTVDIGAYEHLGATTGLRVTLHPYEAVAGGAQWRVDGGAWQNSGAFLAGLPVGGHTVNCSTVSGFVAPADRSISIATGQTAAVNGLYVQSSPPTISVHPVSQTNIVGAFASFSIVAGGPGPLLYQWQKAAAPIPGAATSQYVLASLVLADSGVYQCVVSNAYGATTSGVANLLVLDGTNYVRWDNPSPAWPYTSWETAATNIQDAIDAAGGPGALVLVSNGMYQTGGRVVSGSMTNRVVIHKPITVRSVNGPAVTLIQGAKDPLTTNGNAAVRCAYVGTNATLIGFTLTNGATRTSGDDSRERSGGGAWCEASGVLSNCILSGNAAASGGGGSCSGTLINCKLLYNAAYNGGGAYYGTLHNCLLSGNVAANYGGGAYYGTLNNCSLSGNSAANYGGGAFDGTHRNGIIYFNSAANGSNYWGGGLQYSCAAPLPGGVGNIADDPQFLNRATGDYHLGAGSPCIDRGSNAFVQGTTDLDGNPRIANIFVDMGAYEFAATEPLIALSPGVFSVTVKEGVSASTQTLEVWNGGILTLDYLLATNVPWLSVHPASGSSTGEHDVITVSLATAGLAVGSYTSLVTISSASAGNTPQVCTITLTVIPRLLDHFAWSLLASPQYVGQPMAAQLIAQDAENMTVFRFTNTVSLAGLIAGGVVNTNIGIGAGTSSATYPMGAWYHDQRTQVIYLANEIGGACSITSLAVNVTTIPGQTMQNWTIRLKHTPLAAYPASPVWEDSGWTTAVQTNEPQGATGWRTFIFNSPFEYNGTDNLMVDFSFNNGSYTSSGECQYSAMSENRTVTFWTDSGWGDPLAWAGTSPTPGATVNVPNIRLDALCGSYVSVPIAPDTSGAFSAGVWNGAITVAQEVTNLFLRADDGEGHCGDSGIFNVGVPLLDTDGDGIPDGWEAANGLNPSVSNAPTANADGDWMTDEEEYIADTRPTVSNSVFPFVVLTNPPLGTMELVVDPTSTGRVYGVRWTTNLLNVPQLWTLYPPEKIGTGSAVVFTVTNEVPGRFYRTGVRLP
jgi:hypothetical protein